MLQDAEPEEDEDKDKDKKKKDKVDRIKISTYIKVWDNAMKKCSISELLECYENMLLFQNRNTAHRALCTAEHCCTEGKEY